MRSFLALALAALPLAPLHALSSDEAALRQKVEAILAAAPASTRYGMLVTDQDGAQIFAIAPDQRFIPASNTKLFTTAAAYTRLAEVDAAGRGTAVALEKSGKGTNVVLLGRGDARLSSAADCTENCLATLADAIAAKTRKVRDVIGDDRWFPDERWSPGMSWNNIPTRSGTGISALTLDDNELAAMVAPGAMGEAPKVEGLVYYTLDNRALTVPGSEARLDHWRDPMSMTVRITGTIGAQAPAERLRFGIDDPAHYAAWRLGEMLKARGVKVKGASLSRHRPFLPQDDPKLRGDATVVLPAEPEVLAQLPALPVASDVIVINKVSQNLHAELLIRRIGRLSGSGSIADGQVALRAVMAQAGLPDAGYDLSDGSGMSSYNRISPRAAVALMRWVARQPWAADFRATLPVGGVDGTLRRRFGGTALGGKLFAKTGSLNASNALSGYMVAKSGKTLTFSAISNDCPDAETDKAVAAMDQALLAIAEAN